MDEFAFEAFFSEVPCHAQIEARIVDSDDGLGIQPLDFRSDKIELSHELWQGKKDVDKAHHLKIFHLQDAVHPLRAHARASDAGDVEGRVFCAEGLQQFFTVQVGALFSREDKQVT